VIFLYESLLHIRKKEASFIFILGLIWTAKQALPRFYKQRDTFVKSWSGEGK
jgi:hypothetical protein